MALTALELIRLQQQGRQVLTPKVNAPAPVAMAPAPQFLRAAPGGGSAAPSMGAPGGITTGGVTPNFAIDPISAAGMGVGALGGIADAIGGFTKKSPQFSERMQGVKGSLPARARMPFSPEQKALFGQTFADLTQRLTQIRQGQDAFTQFAKNLDFNSQTINDVKARAEAYRDRAAAKLQGGA